MKTTLLAVTAAAVLLSACATTPNGSTQVAAANGGSGTMYCWKRSLTNAGDNLLCNWETSARDACRSTAEVSLGRGKLAGEPHDAGRCENGEWLVAVSTK